MDAILQFLQENSYWVKLGTIPIVAGLIGWITNWQVIRMIFKPLHFSGFKIGSLKLGRQGIIPANASKMAEIQADLLTEKLLKADEIFDRLNTEEIAGQLSSQMLKLSEKVVNHAMEQKAGNIWKRVPERVKRVIFDRIAADIPKAIISLLEEIKEDHEKLIDFKKMYAETLLRDPELLNEFFLKCGKAEYKFITRFGWWFGLLIGIPLMLSWHFNPAAWFFPIAGILIGAFAHRFAIKMVFEPEQEKGFLFWQLQGSFIKRQDEVSEEYATIISQKVLTAENIWEFMLNENKGEAMYELMEKQVEEVLKDMTSGVVDTVANRFAPKQFQEIKTGIIKDIVFRLPAILRNLYGVFDKSLDIKNLLRERMQDMLPEDFVVVLRPAFEEEGWKLMFRGAVLGGIAGFAQWAFVFGGMM